MNKTPFLIAGLSVLFLSTAAIADGGVYYRFAPDAAPTRAPDTRLTFEARVNVLLGGKTVSGPARYSGAPGAVSAIDGEIRVCAVPDCASGGSWASSASVVDGSVVQVRRDGPTAAGQVVTTSTSVLGLTSTFETTGTSTVSFGSFGTATAEPGAQVDSDLETFQGWSQTPITVTGGEYRVCPSDASCNAFTMAGGMVRDGDQVQLRAVAPTFGGSSTVSVFAGGVSGAFVVTTRDADATPDAFSFGSNVAGVEPGSANSSPAATFVGFDEAPISIDGTGAEYALNGGPFTSAVGVAKIGDTVRVRVTAGAFGETRSAILNVGDTSSSWSVSTRAKDVDPDVLVAFSSVTGATPGNDVLSPVRALTGHDGVSVTVSGTGATVRSCVASDCSDRGAVGWTTSIAEVPRGGFVQMKVTAGAAGASRVATLTYGARVVTWEVGAVSADGYVGGYATAWVPNATRALAFVALPPNTVFTTNADYKAFCESKGFDQNKNASTNSGFVNAGMSDTKVYYANLACSYLGQGNELATRLTGFTNHGLPQGVPLRVRDRGCGDRKSSFNLGQNTSDALVVNSTSSFTYTWNHFGGVYDFDKSKPTSFAENGVIVCQVK